MHTDEIIEAVGGMSWFQILLMFMILGPKMLMAAGMVMMSFAAVTPNQWWCLGVVNDDVNITDAIEPSASNLKYCPSGGNSTCTFVYSTEKHTVIDEWNLLCELKNIAPTMTAVQMGGVLLGNMLAGHLADAIGRKKTYFLSMFFHAAFNLMAAFSVSWQMFMAIRFGIGLMLGGLLCVYFPYYMEFVGRHWRPITGAVPFWPLGSAVLALATWLRPNWSDAHIIVAAIHVPFFFGWFFVPESVRWLAVHGRMEEAEEVVDQMAKWNKRQKPVNTSAVIKQLAEEENKVRDANSKYSYIDIYRGRWIFRTSVINQIVWFFVSFVFYGISFGVGRLTGSLYLNMFLVGMVDLPGLVLSYFLSNKIGRKWAAIVLFGLSLAGAFGVAIVSKTVSDIVTRGPITTTLALVCRLGVAAAWCALQVHTSETYPTPIRNLGYGAASVASRAGGIISPYAFIMGSSDDIFPPFLVVGSAMTVCLLLTLTFRETLGVPLEDTTANISGKPSKPLISASPKLVENTVI